MDRLRKHNIDWILVGALLPILAMGLVTLHSFSAESSVMYRQLIWVIVSLGVFFACSFMDFRFLKNTKMLTGLFIFGNLLLLALFIFSTAIKGSTRWLDLGFFSLQPVDLMKVILALILAKYFSRRHIEIKHIKHIFISGIYMFIPFIMVFLQPDFGSALVLFAIWFGMVLVSGISKKHLAWILGGAVIIFLGLWFFVFAPYQRARIISFVQPLQDIQGAGYNAYQSMITVGSGQLFGKGVGYGTQSRLNFLPEYQTDFIFAAFAEEWGFAGSALLLMLYAIIIWRILRTAMYADGNFASFFSMGIAFFLMTHIIINVGMNIGVMPVTGLPLPFMSRGGSHIFVAMLSLGIIMSFRRFNRSIHKDDLGNEFLGITESEKI